MRPLPKVIRDALADNRIEKLRSRIEKVQVSCGRWMTRLKRAFNQVDKAQRRLSRLNAQVASLEEERCPALLK